MSEKLTYSQALDRLVELSTRALEAARKGWSLEFIEADFDELDAQFDRILGAPNPAKEGDNGGE